MVKMYVTSLKDASKADTCILKKPYLIQFLDFLGLVFGSILPKVKIQIVLPRFSLYVSRYIRAI